MVFGFFPHRNYGPLLMFKQRRYSVKDKEAICPFLRRERKHRWQMPSDLLLKTLNWSSIYQFSIHISLGLSGEVVASWHRMNCHCNGWVKRYRSTALLFLSWCLYTFKCSLGGSGEHSAHSDLVPGSSPLSFSSWPVKSNYSFHKTLRLYKQIGKGRFCPRFRWGITIKLNFNSKSKMAAL